MQPKAKQLLGCQPMREQWLHPEYDITNENWTTIG